VEKRLHKVLSPRAMNGCAATTWAMSPVITFDNEPHDAPFQADMRSTHRSCGRSWRSDKLRSTPIGSLNPTRQTWRNSIGAFLPTGMGYAGIAYGPCSLTQSSQAFASRGSDQMVDRSCAIVWRFSTFLVLRRAREPSGLPGVEVCRRAVAKWADTKNSRALAGM